MRSDKYYSGLSNIINGAALMLISTPIFRDSITESTILDNTLRNFINNSHIFSVTALVGIAVTTIGMVKCVIFFDFESSDLHSDNIYYLNNNKMATISIYDKKKKSSLSDNIIVFIAENIQRPLNDIFYKYKCAKANKDSYTIEKIKDFYSKNNDFFLLLKEDISKLTSDYANSISEYEKETIEKSVISNQAIQKKIKELIKEIEEICDESEKYENDKKQFEKELYAAPYESFVGSTGTLDNLSELMEQYDYDSTEMKKKKRKR